MPMLIKMTSTIGNKSSSRRRPSFLFSSRAFTFIEIMITLSILAAGIVMIYRSFFVCLNAMQHLSNRWEAFQIVEEKFDLLEQQLREEGPMSFSLGHLSEYKQVGGQKMKFDYKLNIYEMENISGVYIAVIDMSWKEHGRLINLHREAAISDHQGA